MLIPPVTVLARRFWSLLFAALWWTCMPAYAAGPDLSATKVCTVNGAQSVLCTITIANIGNVASVAPMSLTDLVTGSSNINLTGAGGSLPVSCTPGAQLINNVPINCGINTSLAAGASGDVLFSFTMPLGGTFTNCASVSQAQNSMTPGDPDSSNNTNICTTISVSPPAPTTGSITIVKDAQPNDGQDFAFTPSQATMPQFLLDDDSDSTLSNMKTYSGLPAGTYAFTETQVSGWTLASISCTPSSGTSTNLSGGTATITLAAGDNIVCTFVNTKPATGSITIVKDAQPNDGQDFAFTPSQATMPQFLLDDDSDSTLSNMKTYSGLPAGTYAFTETQVPGWTLSSISCTPSSGTSTNLTAATATIVLAAGDNIVCTFVNTKPATGSITIVKDAQPNDAQDFAFTPSQATMPQFLLDDDSDSTLSNMKTYSGLPAGTYAFTETQVPGWTLSSISCTPSSGTSTNLSGGTATITLAAGDNIVCTFVNTKPATGSITIVKDAQPNDGQDFAFTPSQATMPQFLLDDDSDSTLSNMKTYSGLPAGTYAFTETQVSGWTLASISCTPSSGTSTNLSGGTATITLAAGDNIVCTFVNTKPATGSITIVKDAQPNDGQDFAFTPSQATMPQFLLDDDSDSTLSNMKTYSGLPAGTYAFTETQVPGWTLASISCTPSSGTSTNLTSATATINLAAGDNIVCTFVNAYTPPTTAKVCGVKFNDLNGNGIQEAGELGLANWQIGVGIASIPSVTTGDKGQYCINDLPVGTYTVSEIPQAPWVQTYPAAPGTHTVTLAAGQQLNGVNFGNTQPSGACYNAPGNAFTLLNNGGFETSPTLSPNGSALVNQSMVYAWTTPSLGGQIALWSNGHQGVPAYSGSKFVELNASTGAQLFSSFTGVPGNTVSISFAHRGRVGFPNQLSVTIHSGNNTPTTLASFTAGTTAWTVNTFTYTLPNNGQTQYVLGFASSDGAAGGNFLDEIQVINMACQDVVIPDLAELGKPKVFSYLEGVYPHLFNGLGVAGQSAQYSYRFYAQTGNYLAIDDMGTIFMLGSFTDNAVATLGTVDSFRTLISRWYAGPISNSRVFDFAAANYPDVFQGTPMAEEIGQYSYRFYPQSGNFLAVDNAGMLYIFGPYTGNTLLQIGEVNALRDAITAWEAGLPQ
jgi:hypothetical protein